VISAASILGDSAAGAGVIATGMAIGGFLAHARPALARAPEAELRASTARGGLIGMTFGVGVIVLSAFFDTLIA